MYSFLLLYVLLTAYIEFFPFKWLSMYKGLSGCQGKDGPNSCQSAQRSVVIRVKWLSKYTELRVKWTQWLSMYMGLSGCQGKMDQTVVKVHRAQWLSG